MFHRRRLVPVIALAVLAMAAIPGKPALAYIDPGTSQAVWTSLAPLLTILVACIAVLLLPFRYVLGRARLLWAGWSKRTKATVAGCIAVLLVAAGVGAGWHFFGPGGGRQPPAGARGKAAYERVFILGLDGLDPGILERMMDAGQLPNFARLRKEGTFAPLQTTIPAQSPVAWTSAATGMNPGRHGIFDFISRDPVKYLPELSTLRLEKRGALSLSGPAFTLPAKAPAFWDIASAQGKKVSVIRWPVTFPPHQVNGRLLSGLGTPDVAGTLGSSMFYTTAARSDGNPSEQDRTTVKWQGSTVSTELFGPRVAGWGGQTTSALPLIIERAGEESVRIRAGKSEPFTLQGGEWSAWRHVEFPGAAGRNCPAIIKFYLAGVSPDLALYCSAPHIDPADPVYAMTYPKEFSKELAKEIGPFATLGQPEDCAAVMQGRIHLGAFLTYCDDVERERELMLDRELKHFDSGVLAVVFDTCDTIQHMFWAAGDPKHPAYNPELAALFGRVIEDYYRRMDGVLGRAMAASRGDTAIMVMSDHGFAGFRREVNLNTWLIEKGYMAVKDPALPVGRLFENVDWSKTKAYAVGYTGLFLNVRDREGQGILEPADEYRRVREEIARALRDWRDPNDGTPVVRTVYPRDEVYQGPYLGDAPDLVIGYTPGYRASFETAVGCALNEPLRDNKSLWSGDHMMDSPCVPGIFLANFKSPVSNPRLVDIAPTVLRLLGVSPPGGMDGQPLL